MKIANDLNFYSTSSKNNYNKLIKKQYNFANPNFQGVSDEQFLKEAIAKKTLPPVETIMEKVSAFIGLSFVKTRRMFDVLLKTLNDSISENAILTQKIVELSKKIRNDELEYRAEFAKNERALRDNFSRTLEQKNALIAEKDAKIAELRKYEGMAKVKSVEELDIISLEQFIELLKEAREAQPKAEQSLLNYLFNGNGQEEFLAQMERSNKILKAKNEGIAQIPGMKEIYDNINLSIGYSPVYVAQDMMTKILKNTEKGIQINYPPIKKQVLENADAIINPMKNKTYSYDTNEKVLTEVIDFYKKLDSNKLNLEYKGWKFKQRSVNSKNRPYYTFVNGLNEKYDIYIEDLAHGLFGNARKTYADGSVEAWTNKAYWE